MIRAKIPKLLKTIAVDIVIAVKAVTSCLEDEGGVLGTRCIE